MQMKSVAEWSHVAAWVPRSFSPHMFATRLQIPILNVRVRLTCWYCWLVIMPSRGEGRQPSASLAPHIWPLMSLDHLHSSVCRLVMLLSRAHGSKKRCMYQ